MSTVPSDQQRQAKAPANVECGRIEDNALSGKDPSLAGVHDDCLVLFNCTFQTCNRDCRDARRRDSSRWTKHAALEPRTIDCTGNSRRLVPSTMQFPGLLAMACLQEIEIVSNFVNLERIQEMRPYALRNTDPGSLLRGVEFTRVVSLEIACCPNIRQ